MSEPTTGAGRDADRPWYHTQYVSTGWCERAKQDVVSGRPLTGCTCGQTERIVAIEAEARATAERDVAALRATVSDRDADLLAVHAELLDLNRRARLADQAHITDHGESCDCALAAALDDLANPAAAEPRPSTFGWPDEWGTVPAEPPAEPKP